MKKKSIALLMAVVMLFGVVVAGTLAWLQAESDAVVNTFTFGDINIRLDETDTDDSTNDKDRDIQNAYDLIPGDTAVKDPKVTIEAGSEKCYVFVTVTEEHNTITVNDMDEQIIKFEINDENWMLVEGNLYVYTTDKTNPAKVDASTAEVVTESVLKAFTVKDENNQDVSQNITVNENLTKAMIEAMAGTDDTYPKISFDACAVQSENIEYTAAVNIAKKLLGLTN